MIAEDIARQIEPQVRALIADVVNAKQAAADSGNAALAQQLYRIEYKLGGLLPPIRGTLHLPLDVARAMKLPQEFSTRAE